MPNKKDEEKLLNVNSSNQTLDDLYANNKNQIEANRKKSLEDAYVSQQLLNKYLPEQIAQKGLTGSGIEELYKQQSDANYIAERAKINNEYNNKSLELQNLYYDEKKKETDEKNKALYDLYSKNIENNVNEKYGFVNDEILNKYAEKAGELGQYSELLKEQIDMYRANDDQKNAMYTDNYNAYISDLASRLGDRDGITDEEYEILVNELENFKDKLGEQNYNSVQDLLYKYKVFNKFNENLKKVNEYGNLDILAYYSNSQLLSDELKAGRITQAEYDEAMAEMDEIAAFLNKDGEKYQYELYRNLYDSDDWESAKNAYLYASNDAGLEKHLKLAGSGLVQTGKKIWNLVKDVFWN